MHDNQQRLNLWNRLTLLKTRADLLTERFDAQVKKDGESAPPCGPTAGAVHADSTDWKPGDKKPKPGDKPGEKKKAMPWDKTDPKDADKDEPVK